MWTKTVGCVREAAKKVLGVLRRTQMGAAREVLESQN